VPLAHGIRKPFFGSVYDRFHKGITSVKIARRTKFIEFLGLIFFFLFFQLVLSQEEDFSDKDLTSKCVECHVGMDTLLAPTPHGLVPSPEGKRIGNLPIGCGDCHPDWEKHLEEPALGNITNPLNAAFEENFEICTQCHSDPHAQGQPEFNIHYENKVDCSTCHSVHQPQARHLLVLPPNDLCLSCHQEIKGKFHLVSHHPVLQKTILCIDCHKILGPLDEPLSFASANIGCFSCHAEFQGPFPYEHGAVNDYTVEKEGCIYCHDPHGSPNPRLLKEPARPLCLNCHLVPKHQTAHGGIWANKNCLECHVDVHGSYTSKNLFTEDLFGGSCFGYGCHTP
jgi:DmsE family decaheme c-type cytochrome